MLSRLKFGLPGYMVKDALGHAHDWQDVSLKRLTDRSNFSPQSALSTKTDAVASISSMPPSSGPSCARRCPMASLPTTTLIPMNCASVETSYCVMPFDARLHSLHLLI